MEEYYIQIITAFIAGTLSIVGGVLIHVVNKFTTKIDHRFEVFSQQMDNRFNGINSHMATISTSVGELNSKIYVVISDQEWHRKETQEHKERVEREIDILKERIEKVVYEG